MCNTDESKKLVLAADAESVVRPTLISALIFEGILNLYDTREVC